MYNAHIGELAEQVNCGRYINSIMCLVSVRPPPAVVTPYSPHWRVTWPRQGIGFVHCFVIFAIQMISVYIDCDLLVTDWKIWIK